MSVEYTVMRNFCASRTAFEQLFPYIKEIKNLMPDMKIIFTLIKKFYETYDLGAIDKTELADFYDLTYPGARDRSSHMEMIEYIYERPTNLAMAKDAIEQMVEKHYAAKIIDKLSLTMAGEKYGTIPDVMSEVEDFIDVMQHPPEDAERPIPCDTSISDLLTEERDFVGYEWPLEGLNTTLGPVRPETLGLIYGFVEAGKTSFSWNIAQHIAKQMVGTDDLICYMGNEESAKRLKTRAVSAFLKLPRAEVIQNPLKYEELVKPMGFEHIKIFQDIETGNQIRNILEDYSPKIAFVDIATDVDVDFGRVVEGVRYLKRLFKWYRRLANEYLTTIIGVVQGASESENKKYLKLSDVYDSKSGIQGNLDFGIGIGRLENDAAKEKWRYINIPKNKLWDGGRCKFSTIFEKEINQWTQT